jgi:hypothetical protein
MRKNPEIVKELQEKHHPFCAELYMRYDEWHCRCNLLDEYDIWHRDGRKGDHA